MHTLQFKDTSLPVVIINCKLAALGIMRSLGPMGVPLYGVDADERSPAMLSRFCRDRFVLDVDERNKNNSLEGLIKIGERLGRPSILIPTSDETALFIAQHGDRLSRHFIFPRNHPDIIRQLISKKEMYDLAKTHRIPTPYTLFPESLDDVLDYSKNGTFPVMLKGIYGNRLQTRTQKKMVIANSKDELIRQYQLLEDSKSPNLMIQEYIPGGDDQIYIFNGYFNNNSDCLAAFTGRKIRQFPVHVGCASLGECLRNDRVSKMTIEFMHSIHYQGILDIGYRLDPRDGEYKVLDINPRIGQAFRLFVAENDMDVIKTLYLDFTGHNQFPIIPREGRRWFIEDFDLISSFHYHQEGSLTFKEWLRSFRRVEEAAWFRWSDPVPFFLMIRGLLKRIVRWSVKKTGIQ